MSIIFDHWGITNVSDFSQDLIKKVLPKLQLLSSRRPKNFKDQLELSLTQVR